MLKMAVVGLGMGGSYGARIHKSDRADFVAMCDMDKEKLDWRVKAYKDEIGAEPRPYNSLEEMIEKEAKLDGIVISVPSGVHYQVATVAARAGINILIDKPIDISSEHIDEIEAAVKEGGVLCGVNYPQRCSAVNNGIKHALETGLLGDPLICDFRLKWFRDQGYYDRGGWRGTWAMDGGGSLMNQGAHYCDLLCWLMGKPKSVVGEFAALNHKIETEDWASGVVVFENGARATISSTTCVFPKSDSSWIEVHGTKGSVFAKDGKLVESNIENIETLAPPPFDYPVADFIDAVEKGRTPLVPLEQGRWSVELITGLYQSAREGRRVAL